MDSQDILTPFDKIQEAITTMNAYLNVFAFNREVFCDKNKNINNDQIGFSITPLRSCITIEKAPIYNPYLYQLSFDGYPSFTQCINRGDIIGIIPQRTKTLEVTMDKITIICSEIRISKEKMYFIKPRILTGKDKIHWINTETPNGFFSLSTEDVISFIVTTKKKVRWISQWDNDEDENDYIVLFQKVNISNLLFSEPYITNNLNKEDVASFNERNKGKKIIGINVEFGIDKSSLSYSIKGQTFIEELSGVNYYWDEYTNNIYSTKVFFEDNQTFVEFIAKLIAQNDMVIVGNEYLSVQGNYQLRMVIPDDEELKLYSNHPIRKDGYQPETLQDEIPLENRVKYISNVIGGDCVHSHESSKIDNSMHSF